MKERVHLGRWRTEKAEQKFRTMEEQLWEERPQRPQPFDVETRFGTTRAYRWPPVNGAAGAGAGAPIVLLHGMGGTSLFWARYAEALPDHDVWAIDIVGDAGRSLQRVPYATAEQLGEALDEALAELGIERAHLVGHSLGGWLSLSLAVGRPARVASLLLLDPVGIGRLHMLRFMLWGFPVLLGGLAPARVRRWMAVRFRMPLLNDKRVIRMALHGQLNHPLRVPPLLPFSDDELRSIAPPVVVLVGALTEVFDCAEVVERCQRLIPHVRVEVVADAGHAFPADHVDLVVSRLPPVIHPSG
jgi:pimeloyl-ACP methyl ester carboxylesterase